MHLQSAVHLSPAFLHLQQVRHPFLQPHYSLSSMLPQVWSNVVHIDQYQSTLVQVLVLLCMMNLSIICMACSDISVGACASFSSALVSSEKEFHATHEVFLPYPTNADTVSYPVSA